MLLRRQLPWLKPSGSRELGGQSRHAVKDQMEQPSHTRSELSSPERDCVLEFVLGAEALVVASITNSFR